jgi:NAD+ synthase (glutamine-hydrolysing)
MTKIKNIKEVKLSEYGMIRVAAVSPELKVANPEFNISIISEQAKLCAEEGAGIVLFPELSISGYTCGDLFFQNILLKSVVTSLDILAKLSGELGIIIIAGAPLECENKLYNCAVVFSGGEVSGIIPKTYLCNYNEFYEKRWFSSAFDLNNDFVKIGEKEIPFGTDLLFSVNNQTKFGIEICEDLWAVIPPSSYLSTSGAQIIFNPSASPEIIGKSNYRRSLIKNQSARTISSYVYASAGGSESSTDLCYGGHLIIAENGLITNENKRYSISSDIVFADIDYEKLNHLRLKKNTFAKSQTFEIREISVNFNEKEVAGLVNLARKDPFLPPEDKVDEICSEILNIQSSALATRLKNTGMKSVSIGISGGLDSALALLVCVRAFQKLNFPLSGIHSLILPALASSKSTQENAQKFAQNLGTSIKIIHISDEVENHLKSLGHGGDYDTVYENTQARIRTMTLMNWANKTTGLVVGTGDLSELALGWCTYNADQMSMYGVNAGVPKTLVKMIVEWAAGLDEFRNVGDILQLILNTKISPELIPNNDNNIQETENIIGSYRLHDFFLYYFFRFGFGPKKIYFLACETYENEFDNQKILDTLEIFYSRFFSNQFKRSAMPDGVKIGSVALSPRGDWRMPSEGDKYIWEKELKELRN